MVQKVDGWRAIILAAGRGTRMKSSVPKVMQPICGREMVGLVADALRGVGFEDVTAIVPPDSSHLAGVLGPDCRLVEQTNPLGTGHALAQAPGPAGRPSEQRPGSQRRRSPHNLRHPVRPDAPTRVRPELPHPSDVQRAPLRRHGPRGAWRGTASCCPLSRRRT